MSINCVKKLLRRLGIRRFIKMEPDDLAEWVEELRLTEGRSTGRPYLVGAAVKSSIRAAQPRVSLKTLREACYRAGPSVEPKPRIHRKVFRCEGANHVLSVGESQTFVPVSVCCGPLSLHVLSRLSIQLSH